MLSRKRKTLGHLDVTKEKGIPKSTLHSCQGIQTVELAPNYTEYGITYLLPVRPYYTYGSTIRTSNSEHLSSKSVRQMYNNTQYVVQYHDTRIHP